MEQEFLTMDYILSYPGMIAIVIMMTQFFKRMFDKLKPNRTKFVVLGLSAVLGVISLIYNGITAWAIVTMIFNIIVVWTASMKTFEVLKGDDTQTINIVNNEDEAIYKEAFDVAMGALNHAKTVKLKIDTSMKKYNSNNI